MLVSREWQAVEYNVLSQMHADGKCDAEIARILSRNDRDIRRARGRLGLESRPPGKPWSIEELASLRRLWDESLNFVEISRRLGRPPRSVHAKCEALGFMKAAKNAPSVNRRMRASEVLALPPLSPNETDLKTRAAATTGLLISMLRAGHTPGQGEYKITSEARCTVSPVDTSRYSIMGSQAAMCAGY